ncbi:MAG: bile acid:sodium symporter family protein [Aureliella sp.]
MLAPEKNWLLRSLLSGSAVACLPLAMAAALLGNALLAELSCVAGVVLAAVRLQLSPNWHPFAFSFWVTAFVLLAVFVPALFTQWGPLPANKAVSPLIQVIMFGMGTTLSAADFARVLVRPKAVLIGMLLQFSVMPLTGWLLTQLLSLPSEIAAGVVLIGACPGGVASNVISHLARGDVALSVTMTACSTLLAPLMTPLMMRWLAGAYIEVPVLTMLVSIVQIVVLPTAAGLLVNYVLQRLRLRGPWVDSLLTAVAMLAICIVIGIIVAQSRQYLLSVGPLVALAAVIHNAVGYALGYWGAKWLKLDETESRTVSIEVGMQNGGMATALATDVLHSPPSALAGAIFGPWMSISGSLLAARWRQRPQ